MHHTIVILNSTFMWILQFMLQYKLVCNMCVEIKNVKKDSLGNVANDNSKGVQ